MRLAKPTAPRSRPTVSRPTGIDRERIEFPKQIAPERIWQEERPFSKAIHRFNLGVMLLALPLTPGPGQARDPDGRYANSPLKQWFDSLKSGKGPCCSDADGSAVSDVDWESKGGRYRVRIEGEWHEVPEDAVITEPNRVGRTMVWPIKGYQGLSIRCFMPGSMT